MYREPYGGRDRPHWLFNADGNIRPYSKKQRAIGMLVIITLAAVTLVIVENLGG